MIQVETGSYYDYINWVWHCVDAALVAVEDWFIFQDEGSMDDTITTGN